MTVVVGTAGHIDHGKTTLLLALTGMDADRLPEERARGMTIDVGYAHLTLDDGEELDFVDVPGHDRLVGNMLVGAGEMDACLLCVAADDGVAAQTLEHLELVDGLGVAAGLAVVTKADLVAPSRVAEVQSRVTDLIAGSSLTGSPVLVVSARTGAGLGGLRAELSRLRDLALERAWWLATGPARLAVDRVFTVRGRGVVVTGSMRGGSLRAGDEPRLLPGGRPVRVREVQVHGRRVERGPESGRVALNLAGVRSTDVRRGAVLVAGAASGGRGPSATSRALALLRPPTPLGRLTRAVWPLRDGFRARLHVGTDQVDVVVGRVGRDHIDRPDGTVLAMLRLERPAALLSGDRFVLRHPSPAGLLAGGVVLDPVPPRGAARRRQTTERVDVLAAAVMGRDEGAIVQALLDLHGLADDGRGPRLAADVRAQLHEVALEAVRSHRAARPTDDGIALTELRGALEAHLRRAVLVPRSRAGAFVEPVIASLAREGRLERVGDRVRLPGSRPAAPSPTLERAMGRLVALLDVASPLPLKEAAREAGCPADGIRALEREGRIVVVGDDLAWSGDAYGRLTAQALELARQAPLRPATLRDATGTSRKFVMALLEDLDRRAILRRTPDGHVPGPRARP
jgi:selenocysteine-specific elongation factor